MTRCAGFGQYSAGSISMPIRLHRVFAANLAQPAIPACSAGPTLCRFLISVGGKFYAQKQDFPDGLSNSGLAVRRCSEDLAANLG
jgi:hypothetical protein